MAQERVHGQSYAVVRNFQHGKVTRKIPPLDSLLGRGEATRRRGGARSSMPEEDALFQLYDAAMQESRLVKEATESEKAIVCYLQDGDVHVCRIHSCPFLQLAEDGSFVCKFSGLVSGVKAERTDFSTGRMAGTSDPDSVCGEPIGGIWKPKKDAPGLSKAAFAAADNIQEQTAPIQYCAISKKPPVPLKRGARCVNEPQAPPRKKPTTSESRDVLFSLAKEAEATLTALVAFEKRPRSMPAESVTDASVIFDKALKKYIKECALKSTRPTLDTVHNLQIEAHTVARAEKKRENVEAGRGALLLKVTIRQALASLVVALWNAAISTPFMLNYKAESFKPFCAGVLYGLKRGVALSDGRCVVPACPELAAALPVLRATAEKSTAKALHSSSHRGLCNLHRAISSCSHEQAQKLFGGAAKIAEGIAYSVSIGKFDI
jgi:hypothetical protein